MPKKTATFLDIARTFYGEAFDVKRKRELAQSLVDWGEMSEDEQRFTVAHLQYLQLQADAGTHRLLGHLCHLLDELAEAFSAAVELSLIESPDEPDDDGVLSEVTVPDVIEAVHEPPREGGAG